ncbi:MAG: hypothetical protein K8S54_15810 [Spirochaetia bacterium]|nr:hypothetical protein [Spirochaetia bacterium]
MNPATLQSYKSIFAECLTSISEEVIPQILAHLEKLPDDAAEFRDAYESAPSLPSHWITTLRFIKFSTVLSSELKPNYEKLMSSYQKLSGQPGADEGKLLGEIGEFLYAVDEITGDLERILPRLMRQIRTGMIESYGIVLSPNEAIYSDRIPDEQLARLNIPIQELAGLCQRMVEQIKISTALSRMEKLILGG